MKVENPAAFCFIFQDDVYLLNADKTLYDTAAAVTAPPVSPPVTNQTPVKAFNYMGGNNKNFLILVHYPGIDFMPDAHLAALNSTLNRIGLQTADTAILNVAHYTGVDFAGLSDHFKPQKVLILGQNAIPAAFNAGIFNQPQTQSGVKLLHTFSFDQMMESTDHKKAFWEQVKVF